MPAPGSPTRATREASSLPVPVPVLMLVLVLVLMLMLLRNQGSFSQRRPFPLSRARSRVTYGGVAETLPAPSSRVVGPLPWLGADSAGLAASANEPEWISSPLTAAGFSPRPAAARVRSPRFGLRKEILKISAPFRP